MYIFGNVLPVSLMIISYQISAIVLCSGRNKLPFCSMNIRPLFVFF